MGANLPAVDLGAGRTAVAVSAGGSHTCVLLVRFHVGKLGNQDMKNEGIDTHAQSTSPQNLSRRKCMGVY